MKSLFLALCVSASAATLPPFPTVKRPAPLISPKAASAPKTVTMTKFTPAGAGSSTVPGLAPVRLTYTKDTIGTFDDIVDTTRVEAVRRVGRGLRFEYTAEPPAKTSRWNFMTDWGATTVEDTVTVQWFVPLDQRQQRMFFRVVEYIPTTIAKASRTVVTNKPRLNTSLKLQTWSAPRK